VWGISRRTSANDVEIHAPKKDFIGAGIRGLDAQALPLIERQVVDSAV
jgi:hypothetical protein